MGVVGFIIDAGLLQICVVGMHANPYAARVFSFLAAASATWLMNRRYTFAVKKKPTHAEWVRYLGLMALGAAVNYGSFALSLAYWSLLSEQPWLGVAIGSIAGLGVNFTTSRLLFRPSKADNNINISP